MTGKGRWMVGTLGVVLILGGIGLWNCARNASETRAERTPTAKTNFTEGLSVQVTLPERHDLFRQVALPGSVEAFEQATLYAKVSGYLKWIKVDIGDRVRKGEVIAEIDVPEMAKEHNAAEAEVQRAKANLTHVQAELERAKAELELKKITYQRLQGVREQEPDVLPQQDVDEAKAQFEVARAMVSVAESKIKVAQSEVGKAEAARERLSTLVQYAKITAPFNGVVTKRYADPGALIQQASSQTNVLPLVTVVQMDTLRVFMDVNEPEVRFVKKGNPVKVTLDALPGKVFEGTCTRFTTVLDPKTRTMRAEIDIPNRDGLLRPGMYGKINLTLERRENVLTVPANALIVEGGKPFVYTAVDGKAKRIEVETGLDDGIRVEITRGLKGSEPVIIAGQNALKDGMPVKVSQTVSL